MRLRRPSRGSPSLLGPDLGRALAEYGYAEFASGEAPWPSDELVQLMVRVQTSPEVTSHAQAAVQEICTASSQAGGWAIYGAPAFLDAFFPDHVGTPEYEALYEARVRYLHDLGLSDIGRHLTPNDRIRWGRLYGN